jgi:hypothetical protein
MSPDDLRESALSRISGDTTFKTLTGATSSDPRLYYRYSDTVGLSTGQKTYAVYALINRRESRDGILDPVLQFVIWSREEFYETLSDTRDRIAALLDRQTWTVGSQRVQGRIVFEADTDLPNDGLVGKMMQIRIAALDL